MWITFYKRPEDSHYRSLRYSLEEEASYMRDWFERRYPGTHAYVSPPKNGRNSQN